MKRAFQLKQEQDDGNQVFNHEEKQSMRINKYLTAAGFCSRREADRLVDEKRVKIGEELAETGMQVAQGQKVYVDDRLVSDKKNHVYIALYKPVGIACTLEPDTEGNIAEFMSYPERIFTVGRLDKDSSGLILLTSDGDIVNKILRAENNHEKEYIVQVNNDIVPQFMEKMASGVEITNMRNKTREVTKKCTVEQTGPHSFRMVLTQGLNRQIRRMCTALGYKIMSLRRVRIMHIRLGGLQVGQWRYLTQDELNQLSKSI